MSTTIGTLIQRESSMPHPEFAQKAGRAALLRVKQFSNTSSLSKPERRVSAQDISWEDIQLGRLLDQGYFSSVYEATLKTRDPDTYYAVKCLRKDIMLCNAEQEETLFHTAAADLALEAQILAKLMHPNIIHLHGSMGGCISESFSKGAGFFLVLDLLVDTLDKRLLKWRRSEKSGGGGGTTTFCWHRCSLFGKKGQQQQQQQRREQLDRIEQVALGVAEGLAYVHSRGILYRDLKPQNIGFDEHGVVRIFDFGLAREANAQGQIRHMTGAAGTPRYMSPECAKSESCSFSSDVYSFAILFWEILTLQKPFERIKSLPQFHEEVVRRNVRPPLHNKIIASPQLRALLEQGWDENPEKRPTFSAICDEIQSHVSQQQSESTESSDHLLRRESSGNTELMMRSNHGSSRQQQQQRSFRVLGLKRDADKTLSSVDRLKWRDWFPLFFKSKKQHVRRESVLDLSGRSLLILQSENPSSHSARRLSGMSQQSKCDSDTNSRRLSGMSMDSERRSSLGSTNQRRSSAGSTNSLSGFLHDQRRRSSSKSQSSSNKECRVSSMTERMAETLAAEAKTNRQVLRQLKSRN